MLGISFGWRTTHCTDIQLGLLASRCPHLKLLHLYFSLGPSCFLQALQRLTVRPIY